MSDKTDHELYELVLDLFVLTDVSEEVLAFMNYYESRASAEARRPDDNSTQEGSSDAERSSR